MKVHATAVLAVSWQCPKCHAFNVTAHDDANTKCAFCHESIRIGSIEYENGAVLERK